MGNHAYYSDGCENLPAEYKLVIGLIKDSMTNVKNQNSYYIDSLLFLADVDNRLTYWLDFLPDLLADNVRIKVNEYLQLNDLIEYGVLKC